MPSDTDALISRIMAIPLPDGEYFLGSLAADVRAALNAKDTRILLLEEAVRFLLPLAIAEKERFCDITCPIHAGDSDDECICDAQAKISVAIDAAEAALTPPPKDKL